MSDLLNRIAAAQRDAGERVVVDDLRERGLLDVISPLPRSLTPDEVLSELHSECGRTDHRGAGYVLRQAILVISALHKQLLERAEVCGESAYPVSMRITAGPRNECICPTCGLRHGGSNVDGGF